VVPRSTTNIRIIFIKAIHYGRKNPLPAAQEEVVRDDRERRGKNNNADAVVEWSDGKQWVVDFKCMLGNGGNLSKRLLEAYEQADYAVVMITGTVNIDAIINMANSFLKNRPSFKMVIIYGSNGELIYKKGNA
jgi:hypothetical protein